MLIVKVIGGIGNQMFQYAVGRNIQLKNGGALKLDINGYKYQFDITPRKFELDIFKLDYKIASQNDIAQLVGFDMLNRVFNRFGVDLKSRSKFFFKEKSFAYDSRINKVGNNVYLEGFWNSEKYFVENEKEIRKDFSFRKELMENNKKIAESISKTNAVSIHIRRGDYIYNKKTNQFHGTCDLNYYQRAIDLIKNKVKNPKFFIFSDDLEWVKNNLKIKNAIYVEGNIDDKSYIDMQLMSLCKHNIIANSSFSWWGAWLNNNPEKIVIAPEKWFNDTTINTKDLLPEGWIKI